MIKIVSDSTCDLSDELVERYGVTILPLFVRLGDREYRDKIEITPDEIFEWSDREKTTPQTAAVSIEDAAELFTKLTEDGSEVIAFCISEKMSTTGNLLRLAARETEREELVHVVDSANLSTGVGLQVIEAAIMAREGKSSGEILKHLDEVKGRVRASFVIDTLVYLQRGGRCSSVAAFAGSVLKLHPRIVVSDGEMSANKKYRGRLDAVIMQYVKDMEQELRAAKPDRVFITHSGCDRSTVESVRSYLESLGVFSEILETRAGGVISSHCGPGTLGVLFIAG